MCSLVWWGEREETGEPWADGAPLQWGLEGGLEARPNSSTLRLPNGTLQTLGKKTRVNVPRGATLEIRTGGGGGHGSPSERDPQTVLDDVQDGYISEAAARRDYPHAFEVGAPFRRLPA